MTNISHQPDCTARIPGPSSLAARLYIRDASHLPTSRVPARAPGRPLAGRGIYPVSARIRRASFSFGLSSRTVNFLCCLFPFCCFRTLGMPLLLHIVCCFSRPFPSSPFTLFLRSSSAFFLALSLHFFPVLPSSLTAFYLSFLPLHCCFVEFPSPLFGCFYTFWVFSPRISLLTIVAVTQIPLCCSFCSSAFSSLLGAGVVRQSRLSVCDSSCPAGSPAAGCVLPNAARQARPGTCVPGGAHGAARPPPSGWDQRSQANCFTKSQLWFLSGEPLSKGTDTKLRGLAHFLPLTPTTPPAPPLLMLSPPDWRRPELPGHPVRGPGEAPAGQSAAGEAISKDSAQGLSFGMGQQIEAGAGTDTSTGQLVQRQPRLGSGPPALFGDRTVQLALAPRASAQEQPKAPELRPTPDGPRRDHPA